MPWSLLWFAVLRGLECDMGGRGLEGGLDVEIGKLAPGEDGEPDAGEHERAER